MKKYFFLFFLIISLASNSFAEIKTLCNFPFGPNGAVKVYYDHRFFDPASFQPNYNQMNGGMKFAFELGNFSNPQDRDYECARIRRVEFINNTVGGMYVITQPLKYIYTTADNTIIYMADYLVWIGGNRQNIIGEWLVIVTTRLHKYIGKFSITPGLMDREAPEQVEIISVEKLNENRYALKFVATNAHFYRVRGFDGDNIIWEKIVPWAISGVELNLEIPFSPDLARIEAVFNNAWLTSGLPCTSPLIQGSVARAITWFKYPLD